MLNWINTDFGNVAHTSVGPVRIKAKNNDDYTALEILSSSGWNIIDRGIKNKLVNFANTLFKPEEETEEIQEEDPYNNLSRDANGIYFQFLNQCDKPNPGDFLYINNKVCLVDKFLYVNTKEEFCVSTDMFGTQNLKKFDVSKVLPMCYHQLPQFYTRYTNYLIKANQIKYIDEVSTNDYFYYYGNLYKFLTAPKKDNNLWYANVLNIKNNIKQYLKFEEDNPIEIPKVINLNEINGFDYTKQVKSIERGKCIWIEGGYKYFKSWEAYPHNYGYILFLNGTKSASMDERNLIPIIK